jgi:Dolichyl-phosphate-mannose-protein mannosyltransferase
VNSVATEALRTDPLAQWEEARYLLPPLILGIILLWIVPMGSSLGLDESGNWWVVKDGVREMLVRAQVWPGGQSVLFNLFVIGARSIGGDSDIVMRIPSLLMMMGTLVLIYRLGKRLAGPLAAMFSCLIFVAMREVIYVASTVRPYALAILLVTGAMLALMKWLDGGELLYAAMYVVLAALTSYATYLYCVMFLVHAAYAIVRIRMRDTPVRPVALLCAWIASGILMLPLAAQVLSAYSRRAGETYLSTPNVEELLASIIPPVVAGAIGLGVIVALALRKPMAGSLQPFPHSWVLAVWALAPPAIILGLSFVTDLRLFAGRYYLANAPGVALALGSILSALEPIWLRRFTSSAIVISAILMYGINEHFMRGLHDYRGAVAAVREQVKDEPETPVIVMSGFNESKTLANVLDPTLSQPLFAPLLRYRIPGHLIFVPLSPLEEDNPYIDQVFTTTLRNKRKFLLVGLFNAEFLRVWLLGRGRELGFHVSFHESYNEVVVIVFERGIEFQEEHPRDIAR